MELDDIDLKADLINLIVDSLTQLKSLSKLPQIIPSLIPSLIWANRYSHTLRKSFFLIIELQGGIAVKAKVWVGSMRSLKVA